MEVVEEEKAVDDFTTALERSLRCPWMGPYIAAL